MILDHRLLQLDFTKISISAALGVDGRLGAVGGIAAKLEAAQKAGIRFVVLAQIHEKGLDERGIRQEGIEPVPNPYNEPNAETRVLYASTLDEAIQKLCDAQRPRYYGYSARPLNTFVGRTQELEKLHSTLMDNSTSTVMVTGMGGQGKSLLAEAYLQRYGAYFPQGIFYLRAEKGVNEALQSVASELQLAFNSEPTVDQLRSDIAAQLARGALAFCGLLMIYPHRMIRPVPLVKRRILINGCCRIRSGI